MNNFDMGSGLGGMGIFGGLLMIFGFIWTVLMFFAPFFWYGAWYRAKQMDEKLEQTNVLLSQIVSKTQSSKTPE